MVRIMNGLATASKAADVENQKWSTKRDPVDEYWDYTTFDANDTVLCIENSNVYICNPETEMFTMI